MRDNFDRDWETHSKALMSELKRWRLEHPKATLREIEEATDHRLDRLRSRLISDTATASGAADWKGLPPEEHPRCPECQAALVARGVQERDLQSQGPEGIPLQRHYGVCPACSAGLFPPR